MSSPVHAKVSVLQRFGPNGTVEDLVRFVWPGQGPVVIEPIHPHGFDGAMELIKEGILSRTHERMDLDDGERFIDEVPWAIHGDRLWATRVKDVIL